MMCAQPTTPLFPRQNQHLLFHLGRSLAVFFGWFLTIAAILFYFDFNEVLTTEERWFAEDVFFNTKEVDLQQTLGYSARGPSTEALQSLRTITGVRIAEPVQRNDFPALLQIGGGSLPALTSEVFFESVPDAALNRIPEEWKWSPSSQSVPLLVPRDFLNLYNFGFAPGKGLPPVSENMAKNIPMNLRIQSEKNGQIHSFDVSIVGFSNQIQTLVVPSAFLEWANREFGSSLKSDEIPKARIIIAGTGIEANALVRELERHELQTTGSAARTARLQIVLDSILGLSVLAGAVILLLNAMLQWAETESSIHQNKKHLRILFLLGHSLKRPALHLIRTQLLFLSSAAIAAFLAAYIIRHFLIDELEDFGFHISAFPQAVALLIIFSLYALLVLWLVARTLLELKSIYKK